MVFQTGVECQGTIIMDIVFKDGTIFTEEYDYKKFVVWFNDITIKHIIIRREYA